MYKLHAGSGIGPGLCPSPDNRVPQLLFVWQDLDSVVFCKQEEGAPFEPFDVLHHVETIPIRHFGLMDKFLFLSKIY